MIREYQRSTMNTIADFHCGVRVDTKVVNCLDRMTIALHQPFSITGRCKINHLFIEAITVWGNQAGLVSFHYDSIDPALAAQDISGASGSVALLARGLRVMFVGGAVATAAVITATAGVSDVICEAPHIVGVRGGNGYIGYDVAAVAVLTGTMQVTVCYTPMEDGASITANW